MSWNRVPGLEVDEPSQLWKGGAVEDALPEEKGGAVEL
jgi:hypothetical protein